ncbi:MAG: BatD family protein, partial [Muribaculaceae bacterium]|nr:BatD family protein [Muribaculaceae bacterium]
MTDNIDHFVKDGELGSEVEVECMVMPKHEGTFTIENVRFSFFNSSTGKYETITAPALEIEVGEGLPGSGKPKVIMEI